ncbi:MAG: TIGR04086 family membrane protein [Oscillospiraceae bacterium]|nr:TIGR04086 family membrane protein [Oscillospiraceae bacterium]
MAKIKGRKRSPEHTAPVIVCFMTGLVAGGAALALMLAISALVMSSAGLSARAGDLLILLCAAAGALVSGFVTAKRCGRSFLLCGLGAGALLFGAVLLCGVMGSRLPDVRDLGKAAVYLTAAMTGGVLCARKGTA